MGDDKAASICSHCPVGCIHFQWQREARRKEKWRTKRVWRQNETVNGTLDMRQGRFGYHFCESEERLSNPYSTKRELQIASWIKHWTAARKIEAGDQFLTWRLDAYRMKIFYNLNL